MSLLKLDSISKSYNKRIILDNISLSINEGEIISIMGRSGAGKTTLLNIIGLIDAPDSGVYYFNHKKTDIKNDKLSSQYRLNEIGFIVQNYALLSNKSVYENIALPLKCMRLTKSQIKNRVEKISHKTNIYDMLDKYPYQLSGGECQRTAIARAIIRNPKLILADEPTGALDENTENEIMNVINDLHNDGVSIIIVTHNPSIAARCQRQLILNNGKLTEKV